MLVCFRVLVVMVILLGGVYPLLVTSIGQVFLHEKAEGELIYSKEGKILGARLLGQVFERPEYFWSRPSATKGLLPSGGDQLSPYDQRFVAAVLEREGLLQKAHGTPMPYADMLMSSASGFDPHLSLTSVLAQKERVFQVRALTLEAQQQVLSYIDTLVRSNTSFFNEEKLVNILELNMFLDSLKK